LIGRTRDRVESSIQYPFENLVSKPGIHRENRTVRVARPDRGCRKSINDAVVAATSLDGSECLDTASERRLSAVILKSEECSAVNANDQVPNRSSGTSTRYGVDDTESFVLIVTFNRETRAEYL
jgi:hypothetical protein